MQVSAEGKRAYPNRRSAGARRIVKVVSSLFLQPRDYDATTEDDSDGALMMPAKGQESDNSGFVSLIEDNGQQVT